MYNIKLLNKISPAGLDNFNKSIYSYSEDIGNPDAILVRSASMHEYEFDKNLIAIARAGAGVNNIPVDKCSENGIAVFNTPGANANAVKELVLLGLLMSSRKIPAAIDWVKSLKGSGSEVLKLVEKGKGQFVGPEISGKKLGVIGLGAIGILVANAASSLGMEVYGYDPYISVDAAWGISRDIKHASNLKDIFSVCDYITIHVPLTPETKDLICSESIATMKKGVRILNFSRAELVTSSDIVEAVKSNDVACYVTDFPTDDQIGINGIIALPHLGASTPESEDNCAKMAALQVIDYLETGSIKNSVNLPDVDVPKTNLTRICAIHKNIPTMLSKLSALLNDFNIDMMVNKSKKDYAYTVMDISGKCPDDMDKKLEEIDGIIRVRIIK